MDPVFIEHPEDPLPEIERALRRAFPGAGICAVGVGRRRRKGDLKDQVTVKVVLREKSDDVEESRRIPARLELVLRILGKRVRVTVPTDVEARPAAAPTRYRIGPLPPEGNDQVAACYAAWREGDVVHLGVVTAGHGLWNEDRTGLLEEARIHLDPFAEPPLLDLPVLATSHLADDGVDVGLLGVGPAGDGLPPGMEVLWKRISVPGVKRLRALLGSVDDLARVDSVFLLPGTRKRATTVAYFPRYRDLVVAGWGTVTLFDVVESEGTDGTFVGGTSGAGLTSRGSGKLALGIQGLSLDPSSGGGHDRTSLGTSFPAARKWLSDRLGTPVELFWNPDEVPPV